MRVFNANRDFELLSAYLDGQLSDNDRRRVEQLLHSRPDLKTTLDELRRTRAVLRMAPRRRAPRNFTLTPEMVGEKPGRKPQPRNTGLFPAFSFASAFATIVLIASLLFEFLPGTLMRQTTGQTAMEQPAFMPTNAASMADQSAEKAAEEPSLGAANEAAPAAPQEAPAAEFSIQDAPGIEMENKAAPPGMGGGSPGIAIIPDYGSPNGEYAKVPGGMGLGGGGDSSYPGDQSFGGPIVIPLEGVNSIEEFRPQETQDQVERLPSQPVLPEGSSPILGVPSDDQQGSITNKSGWGLALIRESERNSLSQPTSEKSQRLILGLPALRFTQIFLAVLAVIAAIGAFLSRRR